MADLISVIMSAYNETESDLRESIDSILNQSYINLEFIIVNDNPDNVELKQLLEEYARKDNRIIIISNEENFGLARSLNRAIDKAAGSFIARMDADDISDLRRLELQHTYLIQHPDCDMVSSNRIDIDENSNEIGTVTNFSILDENIEKVIIFGSVIIHPTVMLRHELYERMQGYNNFKAAQDYDLWLRILGSGYKAHIMPEKLLFYRIRQNSITKVNFYRQYLYTLLALDKYSNRKQNKNCALIYDKSEIEDFLNSHKLNDKQYVNQINQLHESIHEAISRRNYKILIRQIPKLFLYPIMIKILIREYRFKKALKTYNRG